MTTYTDGYQAALSDLSAFIENVQDSGTNIAIEIEKFLDQNTNKVIQYRGYVLTTNINGTKITFNDEWVGSIGGPDHLNAAMAEVDSYIEVRR